MGNLSFIGGGSKNSVTDSDYSVIGGGFINEITESNCSIIVGGYGNCITATYFSGILNGSGNYIGKNSPWSSIQGGQKNNITGYKNAHIIGSNITAYKPNATFVENLYVTGNLTKASGTFKIAHPDPNKTEDYDLLHSFVEAPTAGENIYRYEFLYDKDKGLTDIRLPEYFPFLNENVQVWVSCKDGFFHGYGEYIERDNIVRITGEKNGLTFNVLVVGTRKDDRGVSAWNGPEVLKNTKKREQHTRRTSLGCY